MVVVWFIFTVWQSYLFSDTCKICVQCHTSRSLIWNMIKTIIYMNWPQSGGNITMKWKNVKNSLPIYNTVSLDSLTKWSVALGISRLVLQRWSWNGQLGVTLVKGLCTVIFQVSQDIELLKSVELYSEVGLEMEDWLALTLVRDSACPFPRSPGTELFELVKFYFEEGLQMAGFFWWHCGRNSAWSLFRSPLTQSTLSEKSSSWKMDLELAICQCHWEETPCSHCLDLPRQKILWVSKFILDRKLEMAGKSLVTLRGDTLYSCCWDLSGLSSASF